MREVHDIRRDFAAPVRSGMRMRSNSHQCCKKSGSDLSIDCGLKIVLQVPDKLTSNYQEKPIVLAYSPPIPTPYQKRVEKKTARARRHDWRDLPFNIARTLEVSIEARVFSLFSRRNKRAPGEMRTVLLYGGVCKYSGRTHVTKVMTGHVSFFPIYNKTNQDRKSPNPLIQASLHLW